MRCCLKQTCLTAVPALLLCAAAALAQPQGPETGLEVSREREQVGKLLQTVQQLVANRRFADAEGKLQEAKDLDPAYPPVFSNLGYLYEAWSDELNRSSGTADQIIALRTKALEAYGQLLTLRPDDQYGRDHIKALFYTGYFPRALREPYLAFSSVGFVNDEVRVGALTRRLAYTNSLLFTEGMKLQPGAVGEPVKVPLPVTGENKSCLVNRSCYGYTMAADSDRYLLSLVLSWPSETLSGGKNYSPVATRLAHLLLRFQWYGRLYLTLPRENGLVSGYLCQSGPPGAETYKNALYFYDLDTARSGMEWTRQAAHEYGHLVLPEIGRFARPEPFAAGELGERLFIQYLADEAGLVAGDPWPSEAARRALAALWPDGDFAVAEYITKVCRASQDYWLVAGPDAGLLAGGEAQGAEAMQYLIGFLLWTQSAYGPDMLRNVLQSSASTQPADYVLAFKNLVARQAPQGPMVLDPGCVNVKSSRLKQPPLEGALGRRQVTLQPGDAASYAVYLPAGAWTLLPRPAPAELSVTLDGKGPLPLDQQGAVALGRLGTDGWHTILLQLGDTGQALTLERLTLRLEPQT